MWFRPQSSTTKNVHQSLHRMRLREKLQNGGTSSSIQNSTTCTCGHLTTQFVSAPQRLFANNITSISHTVGRSAVRSLEEFLMHFIGVWWWPFSARQNACAPISRNIMTRMAWNGLGPNWDALCIQIDTDILSPFYGTMRRTSCTSVLKCTFINL